MQKDMRYYIAKGCDEKAAAYFSAGRRKILSVVPNRDHTLTLTFDNGETRLYDASPLLQDGTVFEPLRKWENFSRVYLDEDHCVSWDIDPLVDSRKVWSNKLDLCPDSCYMESVPLRKTGNGK